MIVLSPVFVLALALAALQVPPLRLAARDQLLGLLEGSLQGKLEVDDLRWPSLRHIELSGVRLKDRHGQLVANLGVLSVRVQLAPLFSGAVHLSEVSADGVFVDLGTPGTDRGLLSVFESDAPDEPEPADSGGALVVQIDRLCLEGSALEVQPSPEQGIGLHRFSTCAMFRMAENIAVRLDALRGEIALNGRPVVAFIDEAALRDYDAHKPPGTGSPAQAYLNGKLLLASAGPGFDGRLELRGVNRQTFEAAEVDAEWLQGAADASLVVDGDTSKMNYTLELRAPQSSVRVQGDFAPDKAAHARVWSEGLELARFTTITTEKVVFALALSADLSRPEGPRMAAALESGSYGSWALPTVQLDAELAKDGTITLPKFEARYPAGRVHGRARVGASGALHAALEVQLRELAQIPPLAASLPGWRGEVQAKAEVRRAAASGELTIDAQTTLSRLHSKSPLLAVDRIELKASAWGQADQLAMKANLSASELHIEDQRFAELQLAAHGGPELYQLQGRVDGDRGSLEVWLKPSDDGLEAGGALKAKLPRGEAHARVKRVHLVFGRSLAVEQLRVEHLSANLSADGNLGLAGKPSKLKLRARVDELSALTYELGGADVPGKLSLTADVTGALDQPKVDLQLDFKDGPRLAGAASLLALRAKLDAARGEAEITARGSAGKAVVQAALQSRWPRGAPLSAAVTGHHELELSLDRLAIGELVRQSEAVLPVPLAGTIGAKLHASGNLEALELESEVDVRVRVGEEPELDAKLATHYGGGGLAFNVEIDDPHGNLLTANWHQETRLESFANKPLALPDWLGETNWEARVELASRRISELPTVRTQRLLRELWPLRTELSVQLAHAAGAEPTGDVRVRASWDPNTYDPRHADCTQRVRPKLELVGKLRDGSFVSDLRGTAADQQAFSAKAQLGSKFADWLEGRPLQITRAQFTAKVHALDLAQWPVACEQAAGTLSAAFSATDLFDPQAEFQAKVGGRNLVVAGSMPFDFDLQAQALPSGMDVAMQLDRIGGRATLHGSLPISFYVHDPATSVDMNGKLSLELLMSKVDAKSLLAMVPVVARPSGRFDGRIKVYGTLTQPRGSGVIELHDLSLTLPKLGQRITKVNGRIAVDDNRVRIPELELKDQGGSAKFRAELALESTKAFVVDLHAKFDDFPVRKQGVLIGRADANAKVNVKATEAQTDVEVKLSGVSVNLTGDTSADVQSLDLHPEIVVAGEAVEVEEPQDGAERKAAVVNVYVRSEESLWVRRDDFAVRMRPNVSVHVANGTSKIEGNVKLERGYIVLLGQQFDVKAGTVTFTGGQEVNPNLELTAESTSASGKVVRVEVTGFVRAPKLGFFVAGQAVTAGEALTALTGRESDSGSEESMQNQVASAAMGMTTGLLSLGARREFGDFIPMLSVEQNSEDTRVRAGFEADSLVPKFMRGFVRGAYVEGVVSTQGEGSQSKNQGGGSAQGGVLLELLLPSDLVWAGKYGPGQTWSVDLNWRP